MKAKIFSACHPEKGRFSWRLLFPVLICCLGVACVSTEEQTPEQPLNILPEPTSLSIQPTGNLDPADFTNLLAKAANEGSVRVIVTVDIGQPFQPEGDLPDEAAVQAQREAIQSAQQALVQSLDPDDVTVDTLFQYTPQLALKTNQTGLQALIASPLVIDIVEDKPVPPAKP